MDCGTSTRSGRYRHQPYLGALAAYTPLYKESGVHDCIRTIHQHVIVCLLLINLLFLIVFILKNNKEKMLTVFIFFIICIKALLRNP